MIHPHVGLPRSYAIDIFATVIHFLGFEPRHNQSPAHSTILDEEHRLSHGAEEMRGVKDLWPRVPCSRLDEGLAARQ